MAAIAALGAAIASGRTREKLWPAQAVLGAVFLRGLAWLWLEQTAVAGPRLTGFHGLALLALVVGAAYLCVHLRASLRRARFVVLLVIHAALSLAAEADPLAIAALTAGAWATAGTSEELTSELAAASLLYLPLFLQPPRLSAFGVAVAGIAAFGALRRRSRAPAR